MPQSDVRPIYQVIIRLIILSTVILVASCSPGQDDIIPPIDPDDPAQVARGTEVYQQHCAACHGKNLEGHPDWRKRRPDGRLPAPPHDETGHTWHHPDIVLFGISKHGLVPPYAPEDYASDMPAFGDVLPDEDIAAVLAYIKSTWSPEIRKMQEKFDQQKRDLYK